MPKFILLFLTLAIGTLTARSLEAGALNFREPSDWDVGDLGSTMQNWEASEIVPFLTANTPPTVSSDNPVISSEATMSVQAPGNVATSGGYYSQNNSYPVFANIFNHGGTFGTGGTFSSGYGTRVLIQTAGTTNTDPTIDASVLRSTVQIVKLDNTAIPGGSNANMLPVIELGRQPVSTPFGDAFQEELLFEFYLPGYSGDFRVRFTNAKHCSFQELRIDSLLVQETISIPGDFDGDGDVDDEDLGDWQASYGVDGAADADDDGDSDGRDFLIWQRNYTGPGTITAISVPEPTSLLVVIFGIIMSLPTRAVFQRAN